MEASVALAGDGTFATHRPADHKQHNVVAYPSYNNVTPYSVPFRMRWTSEWIFYRQRHFVVILVNDAVHPTSATLHTTYHKQQITIVAKNNAAPMFRGIG
jgi:hypothetical protein